MAKTKFHLSDDGVPRECDAEEGHCPKGQRAPHFDSETAARKYYEQHHDSRTIVALSKKMWRDSNKKLQIPKGHETTPPDSENIVEEAKENLDVAPEKVMPQEVKVLVRELMKPDSDDIYKQAEYAMRVKNCERFPYKNKISLLSEEEKQRLQRSAKVKGMRPEVLYSEAVRTPVSWIFHMHPTPSKQNFQEVALEEYLKKECENNNFNIKCLPKGGKDSYYLVNGKVVSRAALGKKMDKIKTLDFLVEGKNGKRAVIIAKHTQGGGGAQDNQYHDVINSLEQARDDEKLLVVACLDGDYYSTPGNSNAPTKIEELSTLFQDNSTVFMGDHRSVAVKLKDFLSE